MSSYTSWKNYHLILKLFNLYHIPQKTIHNFKIGESVRMDGGKAIGTIDKIEKGKAIINYGLFTTNVSLERLEFVQIKK